MNDTTYVFKPSQFGTFEEASILCEDGNMSLLETKDESSYEAVLTQARSTGQDAIWFIDSEETKV